MMQGAIKQSLLPLGKTFRDRWDIPIPDDKLGDIPFFIP